MIKAHTLHVFDKNEDDAEVKLGKEFNDWVERHREAEVVKFFEPIRKVKYYPPPNPTSQIMGYTVTMTFFYFMTPERQEKPCALAELTETADNWIYRPEKP